MTDDMPELPEDRRRVIFDALVTTQDGGESVASSRETVAARFGLTVEVVKSIEREGVDRDWLA